jgi:hypothetical protein
MPGVAFSGMEYIGDLNNANERYHRINPAFYFLLQFDSYKRVQPLLSVGFGRFIAQDRTLKPVEGIQPNKYTNTSFFNVNVALRYRFFKRKALRPHLSAGVGVLSFTPRDALGNLLSINATTRKPGESYAGATWVLPFGVGFTWRINSFASLGLEYSYYITGSDYLDNIGALGTRPGNDVLQVLQLSVYWSIDNKARRGREDRAPIETDD